MNVADPTLERLVEAARTGGSNDADELIRAVWPRAYGIALSILRNHSLAEDAAQESCAMLFRYIRRLRSTAAFNTWFYRIVVRQAVAIEKRSVREPLGSEPAIAGDLDDLLVRVDILHALATLPAAQRAAIALHYYAEMNSREISSILNLPDSSVRFHIMRAKKTLEKSLQSFNGNGVTLKELPCGAA
jgi:RNA polymerase sigma-70 factor (ECF subfamily)